MNMTRPNREDGESCEGLNGAELQPKLQPAAAPVRHDRSMVQRVLEVELHRMVFPEDEIDPVSWMAEWAWRESSESTEESGVDLAELVQMVLDDVRRWQGDGVRIEWTFSGDAPDGGTVRAAVMAEGVNLPDLS